MGSNRREFIAGTGAAIAALSSLAACAKRESFAAVADPLAGIAEELLADYPENATSLGIDTGARAALKAKAQRPLGRRPAGDRKACRRAPGAPRPSMQPRSRRRPHRPRRGAHGARDRGRGLRVSLWRRRAAEPQLVLAQCAVCRRAEHRRLPRDPSLLEEQHTVATREDAELISRASWHMPAQLDGETGA